MNGYEVFKVRRENFIPSNRHQVLGEKCPLTLPTVNFFRIWFALFFRFCEKSFSSIGAAWIWTLPKPLQLPLL